MTNMRYICKFRIESRAVKTYSHTQKSVNCSVAVLITNTHRAQWSCLQHSELDQHKILHFAQNFAKTNQSLIWFGIWQILLAWGEPGLATANRQDLPQPPKILGQYDTADNLTKWTEPNFSKPDITCLPKKKTFFVTPPPPPHFATYFEDSDN